MNEFEASWISALKWKLVIFDAKGHRMPRSVESTILPLTFPVLGTRMSFYM